MFSLEDVLRVGMNHQAADALSRLPTGRADTVPLEHDLRVLAIKTPSNAYTIIYFLYTTSNVHNLLDAMYVPFDTPNSTVGTLAMLTSAKFLRDLAKDAYCRAMTSQGEQPNTKFYVDHNEPLVRQSTIDGAIQIVALILLRQLILTLAHYLQCQDIPSGTEYITR